MARTIQARRARPGKPVPWSTPSSTARWRGCVPAAGLLTGFVLGVALALLIGSWASGPDATERRIAELKQEEARRDLEQIKALTELARGSRDRLTPVLAEMANLAPLDGATPRVALTAEVVSGWRDVVSAEVRRYAETPSMGNGVNVARTSMRTAVQQLAASVEGFQSALTAAEPLKGRLVAQAAEQRSLVLRTWSVAALQLDVINIDAGNGHVHVPLPAGSNAGAIPPDAAPEGSGKR